MRLHGASVKEEKFDIDSSLLEMALNDEKRYYPEDYAVYNELAVMDAMADVPEEESASFNSLRYLPSPTFADKMLKADDVLQDRYDELKNYALRFRKVKSRISKKFDSINQGRLQLFKLSIAGKTLKLYLNLDYAEVDPKFHCKDVSDKKTYAPVPVLLRVKSGRAVRYAKMLIDMVAEKYSLRENPKYEEIDAIMSVIESRKA